MQVFSRTEKIFSFDRKRAVSADFENRMLFWGSAFSCVWKILWKTCGKKKYSVENAVRTVENPVRSGENPVGTGDNARWVRQVGAGNAAGGLEGGCRGRQRKSQTAAKLPWCWKGNARRGMPEGGARRGRPKGGRPKGDARRVMPEGGRPEGGAEGDARRGTPKGGCPKGTPGGGRQEGDARRGRKNGKCAGTEPREHRRSDGEKQRKNRDRRQGKRGSTRRERSAHVSYPAFNL